MLYQHDTRMVSFYLTITIFILLITYLGMEDTMRLVRFAEIDIRWHWVIFRSYFLRRKLEKELGIKPISFKEHYQTYGKR
ncbi:gp115 [Synechococcus phage syn9]|uniref:Gp115 n=1 Tax=Synechococcus phage syn9 TaxID=382359 RepID=Q0QZB3_BPSYS|nr:gp115 [Synechococcus phage syn9]ABA47083.1 gp115 [Synechococcus phage syn9]AGH56557.1 hypothetical protein CPUG_00065 [Cyanophage Syn10]